MNAVELIGWHDEERRKTLTSIIASVILHFLLILLVALALSFRPAPLAAVEERPEDLAPVELTLIDPPPAVKPKPAYVDTSQADPTDKPPEDAPFESDRDTKAASAGPATGDLPVPTMEGEQSPELSMQSREYTAGPTPQPSAPAVPAPSLPQTAPAAPPVPERPPEAAPTPRTTTQLALLEPPRPRHTPQPENARPAPPAQPSQPQAARPPGYQPQTRVTRIRGNISNRGRSSVDSVATPLGRYKKMLSDAIGSRWYFYVKQQMDLLNVGTVELRFIVTPEGKAQKVQVVRNSSNESFAACSVQAVMDAEIPPIPADLVPMLDQGRIEIEYSFTILTN